MCWENENHTAISKWDGNVRTYRNQTENVRAHGMLAFFVSANKRWWWWWWRWQSTQERRWCGVRVPYDSATLSRSSNTKMDVYTFENSLWLKRCWLHFAQFPYFNRLNYRKLHALLPITSKHTQIFVSVFSLSFWNMTFALNVGECCWHYSLHFACVASTNCRLLFCQRPFYHYSEWSQWPKFCGFLDFNALYSLCKRCRHFTANMNSSNLLMQRTYFDWSVLCQRPAAMTMQRIDISTRIISTNFI